MNDKQEVLTALFKFQDECPLVKPSDVNDYLKNKYASLKAIKMQIKKALDDNNLRVMQKPMLVDGQPVIHTDIYHTASGQVLDKGDTKLAHKGDNPQSLGSANTYARRYGLVTALDLLVDEDDDGSAAAVLSGDNKVADMALDRAKESLEKAKTLVQLQKEFTKLPPNLKRQLVKLKDERKEALTT